MPDVSNDQIPQPSFRHTSGLRVSGQMNLDALPPQILERLKNGGELTDADMDVIRRAALADAGVEGTLVNSLLDSGLLGRLTTQRTPSGAIVSEGERTFTWTPEAGSSDRPLFEPQTYYELLSGRPDRQRGFFVARRRILDVISWVFAIAVPVGLIVAGIVSGASQETIFFMGLFGLIIAIMIRKSLPRSPFG